MAEITVDDDFFGDEEKVETPEQVDKAFAGGKEPPKEPVETDEAPEGDDEDEFSFSFGDEETPAVAPGQDSDLIRKLRAEIRERDKLIAAARTTAAPPKIEVGEKPTLENCDYDPEKFETELDAWKSRKADADTATETAAKELKTQQDEWHGELANFGKQKAELKIKDFDDAEQEVVGVLSQIQQAIVIKAADNSAKVIYALGKHPEKLKALAEVKDPVKFAVAVSKLEGTLKVTSRKTPPEPEGTVRGSAPLSSGDKALERLEAEADRTGDRTKVVAYNRQKKAKK